MGSSVSPFTSWTTIANTSTTYTSGALTQTTQFRAVVQSGVCAEVNSPRSTVTISTTTWDGTVGIMELPLLLQCSNKWETIHLHQMVVV